MGAAALALAATACSAGGASRDRTPDVDLAGTWLLVSGRTPDGPLAVTSDTHVSLTFDEDSMGGKAACNDYGADHTLDGSSFDIPGSGIEQTLMGCGTAPEELDRTYFAALIEVDTVERDSDELTMTGPGVEIGFRLAEPWPRAAVVGHRWRLVTWIDESGERHRPQWERGLRPFVRFGDGGGSGGRIAASSGCRVLEGRWRMWLGAPHLTRSEWRGRCPDRLMDQEVAVGNALSEPVFEVRRRGGGAELVIGYAHDNSPAEVVYRR